MLLPPCLRTRRAGLDPLKVIDAVGSGAAGSFSINQLGPRIARRDFKPGFYVEHFIKDLVRRCGPLCRLLCGPLCGPVCGGLETAADLQFNGGEVPTPPWRCPPKPLCARVLETCPWLLAPLLLCRSGSLAPQPCLFFLPCPRSPIVCLSHRRASRSRRPSA